MSEIRLLSFPQDEHHNKSACTLTSEKLPVMRTLAGTMDYIREIDPNTAITPHCLRQDVLAGRIPCVMVGNRKRLIDVDKAIAYYAGGISDTGQDFPFEYGQVRRIRE